MSVQQLITEHLDLWTAAHKTRSSAGRGSRSKLDLVGIKKLRELILELAVRGKLVPQDPNDEPASDLLAEINRLKVDLVDEGKIKKQKKSAKISGDEAPFELPKGWMWCRLQDVSEYIQRGKGPNYSDYGKVRVVSQKCIQWHGFDIEPAKYIDDESLASYQDERFLLNNDLLWNSTGTGTVGRISILAGIQPRTLVADSHVTIIRTLKINNKFLRAYIAAPGIQNRIEPTHENALVSGSTKQVELNTGSVINLEVPIPPLAEQHRIIAKVDELMSFCDQLEQSQTDNIAAHEQLVEALLATLITTDGVYTRNAGAISGELNSQNSEDLQTNWQRLAIHFDTLFTTEHSIDQLKQTILQLAVMGKLVPQNPNDEPASELLKKIAIEKEQLVEEGKIKKQKPLPEISEEEKPFELPVGWEWVCWGEILAYDDAAFKRGPFGSSLTKGMFVSHGYKVYEQYCPINDDCTFERYFISDKKFEELKGFAVKAGDFLVSCTGATLGRITQVPTDFKEGVINQALLRVRINNAFIDSNFFKLLFRSPFFQRSIFANSKGSAIPNVKSVGDLKIMPVPLLPIREQKLIVAKVEELMTLCDILKTNLQNTQTTQLALAKSLVEQVVN